MLSIFPFTLSFFISTFQAKRIGVFTSGGNAPGFGAAIKGVVDEATKYNCEVFAYFGGPEGFINRKSCILTPDMCLSWETIGGTPLQTGRYNLEGKKEKVRAVFGQDELDGVVGIGGDDTARSLLAISKFGYRANLIGKTVDNDTPKTDRTFGPDTVVYTTLPSAIALLDDALSTGRIYVTEVMGRDNGTWTYEVFLGISSELSKIMRNLMHSAISISPFVIALIPEVPFEISEIAKHISALKNPTGLILVAEGATDPDKKLLEENAVKKEQMRTILTKEGIDGKWIDRYLPKPSRDDFGHVKKGGIALIVADELNSALDVQVQRVPDLGYQFRCWSPVNPSDSRRAYFMARHATKELICGNSPIMAAQVGTEIVSVPLEEVVQTENRKVTENSYQPFLMPGGYLYKDI